MLSRPILKFLVNKYLIDANALLSKRRYSAAMYLAGYAIELALKYRICRIMLFNKGFPETKNEFENYFLDAKRNELRQMVSNINDIRHHKLPLLLQHSGEKYNVEKNFFHEWSLVKSWTSEMRYRKIIIRKSKCEAFLTSAERIIIEMI